MGIDTIPLHRLIAKLMSATARCFAARNILLLGVVALAMVSNSSCGTKAPTALPPTAPNFSEALQYAQRCALVYEQDATIQAQSGAGVRISISSPVSSGMKAYVELDDAKRVQWIVVRGTSSLIIDRLYTDD